MIGKVVQFVLCALVLVSGAAFEELLPRVFGVGIPVLLMSAVFFSVRRTGSSAFAFAIVAGAVEDVLSALPPMTSVRMTAATSTMARSSPDVALLLRRLGSAWFVPVAVYAGYQVWLSVWVISIGGDVFKRVLLACPVGLATAFATEVALAWLCGKAAADERM